jgi:hypothetical protein
LLLFRGGKVTLKSIAGKALTMVFFKACNADEAWNSENKIVSMMKRSTPMENWSYEAFNSSLARLMLWLLQLGHCFNGLLALLFFSLKHSGKRDKFGWWSDKTLIMMKNWSNEALTLHHIASSVHRFNAVDARHYYYWPYFHKPSPQNKDIISGKKTFLW